MPDAGVVTLESQPDEQHAFGPAAGLVAEWRELRTGGANQGGGVDQTRAEERRWEVEARARRQRATAERWAKLRMVLTLGLWRR